MDFKRYPLRQSLISKFIFKGEERQDICPRQIYLIDILKKYHYVTESMLKGKFFETLCIGSGAGGEMVLDLPRKKLKKAEERENIKRKSLDLPLILGEKTIDQIRIEDQAKRFKILCSRYQITAFDSNTQVRIVVPWAKNPDVHLSMEFDIFPTAIMTNERISEDDTGLRLAIIDLKLTMDLNVQFGAYSWGAPEYMDHIQAYMYHYGARQLIKHIDMNEYIKPLITKNVAEALTNKNINFYYWVFNYKKETLEDKLIKVKWDNLKELEMHESINKAIAVIEEHEEKGWEAIPDYKRCRKCPILDCDKRQSIEEI